MKVTLNLIFCAGQRGMLRDLFHVQDSTTQLIREDIGGGRVRWAFLRENEGSLPLPVPPDVTLQVLELKPNHLGDRMIMFSETGGQSSKKRYPFSWETPEAQEGVAK